MLYRMNQPIAADDHTQLAFQQAFSSGFRDLSRLSLGISEAGWDDLPSREAKICWLIFIIKIR